MSTITFAGNLAADPEVRFTQSGRAVASLTVLENRRKRTADGNAWEDAEPNRYKVEVWGATAENVAESLAKGDRVLVTGTIVTDRWTDRETNADRTAQKVNADEIGFSLRYHTVQATKATRSQAAGEPEATEPADPWA